MVLEVYSLPLSMPASRCTQWKGRNFGLSIYNVPKFQNPTHRDPSFIIPRLKDPVFWARLIQSSLPHGSRLSIHFNPRYTNDRSLCLNQHHVIETTGEQADILNFDIRWLLSSSYTRNRTSWGKPLNKGAVCHTAVPERKQSFAHPGRGGGGEGRSYHCNQLNTHYTHWATHARSVTQSFRAMRHYSEI